MAGALALAVVAGGASAAGPGGALDEATLKALFTDATVRGRHVLHGYDFDRYYAPDGTFRSRNRGSATVDRGTWRIEGDQLCIAWDGFEQWLCRHVIEKADGSRIKVLALGKKKRRVKRIVRYDAFEPGNPDGL